MNTRNEITLIEMTMHCLGRHQVWTHANVPTRVSSRPTPLQRASGGTCCPVNSSTAFQYVNGWHSDRSVPSSLSTYLPGEETAGPSTALGMTANCWDDSKVCGVTTNCSGWQLAFTKTNCSRCGNEKAVSPSFLPVGTFISRVSSRPTPLQRASGGTCCPASRSTVFLSVNSWHSDRSGPDQSVNVYAR
jgi:hypothetical protein